MVEEFKVSAGDFIFERSVKLRDTYKIGNKVGEGAFSTVRMIKHRETGEKRAVKAIHKKALKTQDERDMVFTEVGILRAVDHPGILRLHEFYQDEKNYYIISEFCDGGELFDRILDCGSFSESLAANYMKQVLSVINYLHERNIVHRDLKPENLLLSSKEDDAFIKVIDFGSSDYFQNGEIMTKKEGTPYYIAPQVLRREYTYKCDMWSAGVIMYILLCGYPPFAGSTDQQIMAKVRVGRVSYPSPQWDQISFQAKDLIDKLIKINPEIRLTAKQALQHTWLSHASKLPINRQVQVKILSNLKNFSAEQKLKKATLTFISTQLATREERQQMMEVFSSIDTDSSGTLSAEELRNGFLRIFGGQIQKIDQEVQRVMSAVDIDHSGQIDYSEFVTATLNRNQLLSRQRLEYTFKIFDLDNSGTITAEELQEVLGKYHNYDQAYWNRIIQEGDVNGDGVIDLQEFMRMMLN